MFLEATKEVTQNGLSPCRVSTVTPARARGAGGKAECSASPGRSKRDLLTRFRDGMWLYQQRVFQFNSGPRCSGSARSPSAEETAGERWWPEGTGWMSGELQRGRRVPQSPAVWYQMKIPPSLLLHGAHRSNNSAFQRTGALKEVIGNLSVKRCHFASEQTVFLCLGSCLLLCGLDLGISGRSFAQC